VPWFTWLADGAGQDPLRLLAVVQTLPEARAEAEAALRRRAVEERTAETRQARWREQEAARLAQAGPAMVKALAWSAPVLVLWLIGTMLINSEFGHHPKTVGVGATQGAQPMAFGWLVFYTLLAWGIEAGAEVLVARQQGGDYLPYGPWAWASRALGAGGRGLSRASRAVSAASRQQGVKGCGCVLVACLLPLFLVLTVLAARVLAEELWVMVMLGVAVAHAVAAGLRLHRWRQAHDQERAEALG
jgi:hypothetical protein